MRLFIRKERWGLSRIGLVCLLALSFIVVLAVVWGLMPFLAVNDVKNTPVLVIEGWVADNISKDASDLVKSGKYKQIITSGGPLAYGHMLADYQTYAHAVTATLRKYGVQDESIKTVAAPKTMKDRTFVSALALKSWISTNSPGLNCVNVITAGSHARRTRLLFQKALGPEFTVGVIAIPDESFDPKHWWRTSEGFRTVTGEAIAYFYVRFLFSN